MTGRARAVANRLLVAFVATLIAWLVEWGSNLGLILVCVAALALLSGLARWAFGGVGVLFHWAVRYRGVDIGLAELGDIIGEHRDDMRRAGLTVPQRARTSRRTGKARPLPDLVPRLSHRPYDGGIAVTLEAVRAAQSQEDIVRAVPRLRSAWGVDEIEVETKPGGRVVELRIPLNPRGTGSAPEPRVAVEPDADVVDHAPLDVMDDDDLVGVETGAIIIDREGAGAPRREPVAPSAAHVDGFHRPPDAPPVQVRRHSKPQTRDDTKPPARDLERPQTRDDTKPRARTEPMPPTIHPQSPHVEPDDRGHYSVAAVPLDVARSFTPKPSAPNPAVHLPSADRAGSAETAHDRGPVLNGGDQPNPTDVDLRRWNKRR